MISTNIPRTDVALAKDGKWFPYINGVELKIARANSKEYISDLAKVVKEHEELLKKDDADSLKLQRTLMAELYAAHILLDWRGVRDEQDNPVAYSKSLAAEMLADEGYDALYSFCTNCARKASNYYVAYKADTLKK